MGKILADAGALRERFRTLSRRAEAPHRDFGALPVFGVVPEDDDAPAAVERPDLAALAREGGGS